MAACSRPRRPCCPSSPTSQAVGRSSSIAGRLMGPVEALEDPSFLTLLQPCLRLGGGGAFSFAAGFSRASTVAGHQPVRRWPRSRSSDLRARAGATACPRTGPREFFIDDSLGTSLLRSQLADHRRSTTSVSNRSSSTRVVGMSPPRRTEARAITARSFRTPRHSEAPGNHLLDTDDLQGLHQLLLFLGQRTQHALQLRKQGMLDGLPVGGESGDAQVIHFLRTTANRTLRRKRNASSRFTMAQDK